MTIKIKPLNRNESERVIQSVELLHGCYSNNQRYTVERLIEELKPMPKPIYRKFFVATTNSKQGERIVGVGGIKAADWASDTHLLYLSAVHADFRNKGIGKGLVEARLEWLKREYQSGKVLVSTQKHERFKRLGFNQISKVCERDRSIMLLEY